MSELNFERMPQDRYIEAITDFVNKIDRDSSPDPQKWKILKKLLEDIPAQKWKLDTNIFISKTNSKNNSLHAAIECAKQKRYLESPANTSILQNAISAILQVVPDLLNIKNHNGLTPVALAVKEDINGLTDSFKKNRHHINLSLLTSLDSIQDESLGTKWSCLGYAIAKCSNDMVARLMEYGINPNKPVNEEGDSALFYLQFRLLQSDEREAKMASSKANGAKIRAGRNQVKFLRKNGNLRDLKWRDCSVTGILYILRFGFGDLIRKKPSVKPPKQLEVDAQTTKTLKATDLKRPQAATEQQLGANQPRKGTTPNPQR